MDGGLTIQIIALASLVVVAAFLVRGLTGFGSGPVMVPLLVMFLDMKVAVPTAAALAVVTGVFLLFTFQTRRWIRRDVLLTLIPPYIVGSLLGTYVLASFNTDVLKILFAAFIGLYALKILLLDSRRGEETIVGLADGIVEDTSAVEGAPTAVYAGRKGKEISSYWGVLAGFVGGITGGTFAAGGPPVVIYLNRKIQDKSAFRATNVFMFLILDSWRAILYVYAGLMSATVLKLSLYLLPALVVGNIVGSLLHIKVEQTVFNRIVALVLLALAVLLVVQ